MISELCERMGYVPYENASLSLSISPTEDGLGTIDLEDARRGINLEYLRLYVLEKLLTSLCLEQLPRRGREIHCSGPAEAFFLCL